MEKEQIQTKKCKRCQSEIDVNAKQCIHCKKWVVEKGHKKALKFIGLIFAILIIVIVVVALNSEDVDYCSNANIITIEKMYEDHTENRANANDTYLNNYFIIQVKVKSIGDSRVVVNDIEDEFGVNDMYFEYKNEFREQVKDLKKGDTIKICGQIKHTLGEWYKVTKGCIIE